MGSWEHLRFALAVHREGSFAAAARSLVVELTTVARRVRALEEQTGAKLFVRRPNALVVTDAGRAVVTAATRMEDAMLALQRTLTAEASAPGPVRVAMTDAMAERFVATGGPKLAARVVEAQVEIVASSAAVDLSRGEADVAVRLLRPEERDLVARRVGSLRYGLFGSEAYLERAGRPSLAAGLSGHAVVLGSGVLGRTPEGSWLEEMSAGARIALRSSSLIVLRAAMVAGLGLGVLPRGLGDTKAGLVCVGEPSGLPKRDVFIVMHQDLQRNRRVRAVVELLDEFLSSAYRTS